MVIKLTENIIFKGSNEKCSLLDVYSPIKEGKWPIVIFVHGFKGFKSWGHFPVLLKEISCQGFHVISFNMTHNGGTVDNPIDFADLESFSNNTYSKELFDLKSVIGWIKTTNNLMHADKKNISLIGHSRGGGISILESSRNQDVKKIITWASVDDFITRLPDKIELDEWKSQKVKFFINGRTNQEMPIKYDFVEDLLANKNYLSILNAVNEISIPQLIIHGTKDEAVSVNAALNLKRANQKAEIYLIDGAGHTFGGKHPFLENELPIHSKELIDKTISFLKF
jgi:pimeloyl-ACP methyl ester carboxylesterase